MKISRWTARLAMALVAGSLVVSPAQAQETPAAIAAAERLAAEGRHAEAAERLLAYLEDHPAESGVHWRAAQLLLRGGETRAALERYGIALHLTPTDPWLRVEYAEALLNAGRTADAVATAAPLAGGTPAAAAADTPPEARARALTVLGTAAYWRGELTEAMARFEAALAASPGHGAAAGSLREIREGLRPWGRMALEGFSDDQPLRRGVARLEAGAFLTPAWTAAVRIAGHSFDGAPDGTAAAAEAMAVLAGRVPGAGVDATAGAGAAFQEGAALVGELEVGVRLPRQLRLAARADRSRYLWTAASADTLLMVEGVELVLDRADAPGWAGELVLRGERFPDGNTLTTAYGWVLAPLVTGLRAGWSSAWQDAAETRWSPDLERYDPYFTPEEQLAHSLLADARVTIGAVTLGLNASYAVRATELAPMAAATGGAPSPGGPPGTVPGRPGDAAVAFSERSYSPWRALATVDVPLGARSRLRLEAGREETAYYALSRGSIIVVLRP